MMELKEAAEWFRNDLGDGKCSEDCVQCNANEIALEAIEKQIPEKLLPEQRYYGIGKCPRCGVVFTDDSTNYCGNCGQAIDWEEGEADA